MVHRTYTVLNYTDNIVGVPFLKPRSLKTTILTVS